MTTFACIRGLWRALDDEPDKIAGTNVAVAPSEDAYGVSIAASPAPTPDEALRELRDDFPSLFIVLDSICARLTAIEAQMAATRPAAEPLASNVKPAISGLLTTADGDHRPGRWTAWTAPTREA